jgi:Contractile injection system tube protein
VERVTFLVEKTGLRIDCQLNPEKVVVRRTAGVRRRSTSTGPISGTTSEDPLLFTGGGTTEIELDLLFDASLRVTTGTTRDPESMVRDDVRDLTGPLLRLAEGSDSNDKSELIQVRFIWGKHWNVLGVVSAVAERLEYFTPEGAPQRSWLRMRLLRVAEERTSTELSSGLLNGTGAEFPSESAVPTEQIGVHEVLGAGSSMSDENAVTQRPDEIAWLNFFDPAEWRPILQFNGISDAFGLAPGQRLRIPPRSWLGR